MTNLFGWHDAFVFQNSSHESPEGIFSSQEREELSHTVLIILIKCMRLISTMF